MKELIDKLTTYNLFNYLLPGVVFVIFADKLIGYSLIQENNVIGVFLYYFIGMTVSRFGSVIIEPILRTLKFLKYKDYSSFVAASKKDAKIDLLSEVNNTYRTIVATFVSVLVLKAYKLLEDTYTISATLNSLLIIVLILLLYLFSYRKQTNYVRKRVEANEKEE